MGIYHPIFLEYESKDSHNGVTDMFNLNGMSLKPGILIEAIP